MCSFFSNLGSYNQPISKIITLNSKTTLVSIKNKSKIFMYPFKDFNLKLLDQGVAIKIM